MATIACLQVYDRGNFRGIVNPTVEEGEPQKFADEGKTCKDAAIE